ncbi:hypothetical protein ACVJBD_001883 [Rhizobium mongolense]
MRPCPLPLKPARQESAADLGVLAAAVPGASDLVFLSREEVRIRAVLAAPGVASMAWLTAPTIAENTIIALDAAALAIGEGDLEFSVTEEALVVTEDSERR